MDPQDIIFDRTQLPDYTQAILKYVDPHLEALCKELDGPIVLWGPSTLRILNTSPDQTTVVVRLDLLVVLPIRQVIELEHSTQREDADPIHRAPPAAVRHYDLPPELSHRAPKLHLRIGAITQAYFKGVHWDTYPARCVLYEPPTAIVSPSPTIHAELAPEAPKTEQPTQDIVLTPDAPSKANPEPCIEGKAECNPGLTCIVDGCDEGPFPLLDCNGSDGGGRCFSHRRAYERDHQNPAQPTTHLEPPVVPPAEVQAAETPIEPQTNPNDLALPDNTKMFILLAGPHCDSLAAFLGGPIYLVGSALTSNSPSDYDLRVVLQPEDWSRLFGPNTSYPPGQRFSPLHLRCWKESLKQSRRLTRTLRFIYRVDLQFVDAPSFFKHTGPRLRVDQIPDDALNAGLGNPL